MNNIQGKIKSVKIHQRRYLGSKKKILPLIENVISQEVGDFCSLCDIFAGTGVVGHYFNEKSKSIISNDILYSNYIILYAWLSQDEFSVNRILDFINYLNNIKPISDNYISHNFGDLYFTYENALKIGAIREEIEVFNISFKEKAILITSLLYAADKVANTVGHYDAYRIKMDTFQSVKLLLPKIENSLNINNLIFNKDSNDLIKEISCDVLYIDPPYNSRQYCDTYHLLENIAKWEKPPVYGKAKKFDRSNLKSNFNKTSAPLALRDLLENANSRYILISYNNTGEKRHSRSNAMISDEEIMDIIEAKGNVKIFEQEYKMFSTGKTKLSQNRERVFFLEVKNA
ncbi:DNA adenine methylase [Candidatus Dependentiae bacterium]|nr:DNA adenine methylase [Candidatus Dependentiae bacterium]